MTTTTTMAELPGLTVTRPSLEDAYLRITGQAGIGAGHGD